MLKTFKNKLGLIILLSILILAVVGCSRDEDFSEKGEIYLQSSNIKDYQIVEKDFVIELNFSDEIVDSEINLFKNGEKIDHEKGIRGDKVEISDFVIGSASHYSLAFRVKNESGGELRDRITFLTAREDYPAIDNYNDTMMQVFYWELGQDPSRPEEEDLWLLLQDRAEKIADLGITSLWLPPANKASGGIDDVGYGTYDLWDLGEFNQHGAIRTKYGTREELEGALDTIGKAGMDAYFDLIFNHRMGGRLEEDIPLKLDDYIHVESVGNGEWKFIFDPSEYDLEVGDISNVHLAGEMNDWDDENTNYSLSREGDYWVGTFSIEEGTWFKWIVDGDWTPGGTGNHLVVSEQRSALDAYTDFSGLEGRNEYYSNANQWEWDWQAFDGVDWDGGTNQAISPTLFEGKSWDNTYGDDYLMGSDVDYSNEDVRDEMKEWGQWIVNDIGFDGFRLDAIKHVDSDFTREWIEYVQKSTDQDVFFVAEAWENADNSLAGYLNHVGNSDLTAFDFPLRAAFADMRDGRLNFSDFANRGLVNREGYQDRAVTFVDNHDTDRDGDEYGDSIYSHKYQAYTYILMRQHGVPKVYWKDYYIEGMGKGLDRLLEARKHFAYGEGHEVDVNDRDTYGYVRAGNGNSTGLVMLISQSNDGGVTTKSINSRQPNTEFYDITGNVNERVTTDSNGYGDFMVEESEARGWSVWLPVVD